MAKVTRFEDLMSWRKARELNRLVYAWSGKDGFSKDFELRNQMRRASISVMSNIAEGFERGGDNEFVQFLSIAKGSCGEIRAQLYAALDLEYLTENEFREMFERTIEVSRLISGFID